MFLSFITDESNSYKIIKIFKLDRTEVCSYCFEDIIPDEIWLMFLKLCNCETGKITLTDDEMKLLKEQIINKG